MEKIEENEVLLDPETEFLLSKRETGNEWELYKENVRPLKRGRKVSILNDALNFHNHHLLKKSLFEHRRSTFLLLLLLHFFLSSLLMVRLFRVFLISGS